MTAPILLQPKPQFCDANGKPYAGGAIFTYVKGTTTPKTTWKDPGQAATNTNPITLDAAGRCDMWGDGDYQLELHDAAGALIWSAPSTTVVSAAMYPVVSAPTTLDAMNALGVPALVAVETDRAMAVEADLYANDARFLQLAGGTMVNDGTTDGSLFLEHDPVSGMEASNKRYVDDGTVRLQGSIDVLVADVAGLAPGPSPLVHAGSATLGSSGYVHVAFSPAFPTACDAVTATISDISYPSSGVGPLTFLINNVTTSGADVSAYHAAGGVTTPLTFWWVAAGH